MSVTTHSPDAAVESTDPDRGILILEAVPVTDVHGALTEDSSSFEVLTESLQLPTPSKRGFLRRVLRAVGAAADGVVAIFVSWLYRPVATTAQHTARYARRTARAHVYRPRHNAPRMWYGRMCSTSERNTAAAQAARDAATEGELCELPDHFVSWLYSAVQTMREEQDVLHPRQPRGRHFICS